ncbi:TPA: hypothetical protein ACN33X_001523 [Vibrio parahaemolyticus]
MQLQLIYILAVDLNAVKEKRNAYGLLVQTVEIQSWKHEACAKGIRVIEFCAFDRDTSHYFE